MFVDQTTMSHLVEPVSSVLTVGTATMGDAVLLTVALACVLPILTFHRNYIGCTRSKGELLLYSLIPMQAPLIGN